MRRPQKVRVLALQTRTRGPHNKKSHVVRWKVNGREHARAFGVRAVADDYRSRLIVSSRDGEQFDVATGEPISWKRSTETFYEFARRWVRLQSETWAARSLRSAVEAVERAVVIAVVPTATDPPPAVRQHVHEAMTNADAGADLDGIRWLKKHSLTFDALDTETVQLIHDGLGLRLDGGQLAPSTATRYRKVVKAMIAAAAAEHKLPADLWPEPSRAKRRSQKTLKAIDVNLLPNPNQIMDVIAAIPSHQPGSRGIQVISYIAWYLGTRPGETKALRVEDFRLPKDGWGSVNVVRSLEPDDSDGPTKTGDTRAVPVHPVLVSILRDWSGDRTHGRLVETRGGKPHTQSNWSRTLKRACRVAGVPEFTPYTLRHANATLMLRTGVSPGEAARRLGHSVETLMTTYAGVMRGDSQLANELLDEAFGEVPPR